MSEDLVASAGKDPIEDNRRRGYIEAMKDILNTEMESSND